MKHLFNKKIGAFTVPWLVVLALNAAVEAQPIFTDGPYYYLTNTLTFEDDTMLTVIIDRKPRHYTECAARVMKGIPKNLDDAAFWRETATALWGRKVVHVEEGCAIGMHEILHIPPQ